MTIITNQVTSNKNITAKKQITITTEGGLVTRKIGEVFILANSFSSRILVGANGDEYNSAKSLFSWQALDLNQGQTLHVVAEGEDADQAVNSIAQLIARL